jgi:hypothetical protein
MRQSTTHSNPSVARPGHGRLLAVSVGVAAAAAAMLVPAVAQAETITGMFRYADKDPGTNLVSLQPIRSARVEIHRFRPRELGIWRWGHDATTTTDLNGRISFPIDFVAPGVVYAVKVFASNPGAIVWPNDFAHTVPFHREPGEPDGRTIHRVATSDLSVLDFSYDFMDEWSAQHYNIAETIRRGFTFIRSRRDPRQTDFLPPAGVQPTSVTNSWYNQPFDTVVITSGDAFSDFLILHEYAHFVEQHIGMFLPLPSDHDGCTANLIGFDVTVPAHAWMEGFADWFAAAVGLSPAGIGLAGFGIHGFSTPPAELESPPGCSVLPNGDRIQVRVAGALWDLVDLSGDPAAVAEPHDVLGRRSTEIFEIFDHELDPPDAPLRVAPDVTAFRTAWIQRGLPACELGRIFRGLSIPMHRNFPPIANAGSNQIVRAGTLVRLNARRSCDPELQPARGTAWRQIRGTPVTLSNPRTATPTFVAPAAPARLVFRLVVSDGTLAGADTVVVGVVR